MQHEKAKTLTAQKDYIILQDYSDIASGKHQISSAWKRKKTHKAILFIGGVFVYRLQFQLSSSVHLITSDR